MVKVAVFRLRVLIEYEKLRFEVDGTSRACGASRVSTVQREWVPTEDDPHVPIQEPDLFLSAKV